MLCAHSANNNICFIYLELFNRKARGMDSSWKAMVAKTSESINAFSDFEPEYFGLKSKFLCFTYKFMGSK